VAILSFHQDATEGKRKKVEEEHVGHPPFVPLFFLSFTAILSHICKFEVPFSTFT
jgi:hypothetical protein